MNTKLSARVLIVLATLMILLTACGSSTSLQEEIIGQWQIENETRDPVIIFSFKEAGALTIWTEDIPTDGTYTWLDDTTIQMTLTINDQSQDTVGTVSIEGDQLIITNEAGEAETLTRVE